MDKQEIELRIYAEAGQACRSHEMTSRTGVLLFIAIQTAILAFIQREGLLCASNIPIELFGIFTCFVVYVMVVRQRLYYRSYIKTARRIERTLDPQLRLYTRAWRFVSRATRRRGQWIEKVIAYSGQLLGQKIGSADRWFRKKATNKWLLSVIPVVLGWAYVGLIAIQIIF